MSLPKVGVQAVVDNSDGYIRAMKAIEKSNEQVVDSVNALVKKQDDMSASSGHMGHIMDVAFGSFLSGAISKAIDLAAAAIGNIINAVMQFGANTINAGINFSQVMANIQSVTNKTGEEMSNLRDDILKMGSESIAGPQATAEAFYDIVSGVSDATTHLSILEQAIATSEAGQANLTATTKGLVSVMNAYKVSAEGAQQVSDIFTLTVGKGVGTMDQFVEAMSPLAGLASANGVSFKELGAMMSYMTQNGIDAGRAATYIKQSITQLSRKTPGIIKALKAMGETSLEASISHHGLPTTS